MVDSTASTQQERLDNELAILEAIYPGQVKWLDRNREVVYTDEDGVSSLVLRLPDGYLIDASPQVITATARGSDLRDRMQTLSEGREPEVEVLDAIIEEFRGLTEGLSATEESSVNTVKQDKPLARATVIVWLHHLLNTNKRKQASSPSLRDVAGYTKPGYPGVLLFTGEASAVHAHVRELRVLNWQAFQVRLESEEAWELPHEGIVEVESIGEIASGLSEAHKEAFLSAMKIK